MPSPPLIERVLLVAGAPNAGKSVQLRSMFRDPRFGTSGDIPGARNLAETYALSPFRSLYLRLTSPHERGETLKGFLQKIATKTVFGRWNVASAVQIDAANSMPDLVKVVDAIDSRFSPERIRVVLLSPDQHGVLLASATAVMAAFHRNKVCEVICIDARSRDSNGLLLADTFDFA